MVSRYYGKTLFLTLLVVLFISQGCGGRTSPTPLMTLPSKIETITPAATKTPSPKPTITDTATPDYFATQNFIETDSVNAVISTVEPVVLASYSSPDGKWRVEVILYDCVNYSYGDYIGIIAYEQLKLINLREGTEMIVDDQRLNCDGVGAGGLAGLYWSPNNRYFYYNDSREGFPDGCCGNYLALPIYRLDTITWETIMVGGGHISPDKTKLAMWQGNEIVIWDLDKGEIVRVAPLKSGLFNGRMWWSNKGNSISYLQTEFECAPNFGKSYLVSLELTNLSQNLITEYELASTGFVSTPVPVGVFVFLFYAPLIMNYDPSIWEIKNVLQAKELASCYIAEQGPTDFNGPHTIQVVQLGNVKYEVLSFLDSSSSPGVVSKAYIAEQALATEWGLPVFWISAKLDEWNECKKLAEDVLSTLHSPTN